MQETTQRIIKLLGLLLPRVTAGSLEQEMLVPDATLSVIKPSIALQSPYMQIRVKLFFLNENAAKHLLLHLDPCQSTQPSHGLDAT